MKAVGAIFHQHLSISHFTHFQSPKVNNQMPMASKVWPSMKTEVTTAYLKVLTRHWSYHQPTVRLIIQCAKKQNKTGYLPTPKSCSLGSPKKFLYFFFFKRKRKTCFWLKLVLVSGCFKKKKNAMLHNSTMNKCRFAHLNKHLQEIWKKERKK